MLGRGGIIVSSVKSEFDWKCEPGAEKWLHAYLREYEEQSAIVATLKRELYEKTSTRLFDWIDHLVVTESGHVEEELRANGFEQEGAAPGYRIFTHFRAKLPSVVVNDSHSTLLKGIALKVESIADFLMVRGQGGVIEGTPFSPYRRTCVAVENKVALYAVERRGSRVMEPIYAPPTYLQDYLYAAEKWQGRRRSSKREEEEMAEALNLAEEFVRLIGKGPAAWVVFEGERKYWQVRNRAATIQKNRQDTLGLGWGNHDHHTFRSSRKYFTSLVRLFEIVGFQCRERYHAGEKAGWGAQIMENREAGLIAFLDVDLAPQELAIDFAHHPLADRKELSTVGLWCALHGDSILRSGMHHLEAQFDFEKLSSDLQSYQIGMMKPFSNFSYLRQVFTEPEKWPVEPKRIHSLLEQGSITAEEADKFLKEGAVGSHLENLERNEGYKGFNKDNVNLIIQWTDPRTLT